MTRKLQEAGGGGRGGEFKEDARQQGASLFSFFESSGRACRRALGPCQNFVIGRDGEWRPDGRAHCQGYSQSFFTITTRDEPQRLPGPYTALFFLLQNAQWTSSPTLPRRESESYVQRAAFTREERDECYEDCIL